MPPEKLTNCILQTSSKNAFVLTVVIIISLAQIAHLSRNAQHLTWRYYIHTVKTLNHTEHQKLGQSICYKDIWFLTDIISQAPKSELILTRITLSFWEELCRSQWINNSPTLCPGKAAVLVRKWAGSVPWSSGRLTSWWHLNAGEHLLIFLLWPNPEQKLIHPAGVLSQM